MKVGEIILMQESIYMHRGTSDRVVITDKTGLNGNCRIYYRSVQGGPIIHMGRCQFRRKYTHLKGQKI